MLFDLMGITPYLVHVLATLTVAAQVVAVFLAGMLLRDVCMKKKGQTKMLSWISQRGTFLLFLVALTAVSGSLFFSEIALWTPCKLCWLQRIFMYPQLPLLALALWRKERTVIPYVLFLSLIGLMISMFHYTEQVQAMLFPDSFDPFQPCDLTGVSCRATYILEYGYITVPMMALTAFALFSLGSLSMLTSTRKKS